MTTESITIQSIDVRKLLSAASPDAALLYIYISAGNDPAQAASALNLNKKGLYFLLSNRLRSIPL